MEYVIGVLVVITALIFIIRMLGAWMLRINDIIKELKQIKLLLKKLVEMQEIEN